MSFEPINTDIYGWKTAHEFLAEVYEGDLSIVDAWSWVDELRKEGLAQLANEVELRLPPAPR